VLVASEKWVSSRIWDCGLVKCLRNEESTCFASSPAPSKVYLPQETEHGLKSEKRSEIH